MRIAFSILVALCFFNIIEGQPKTDNTLKLIIGTGIYSGPNVSDVIYVYDFNCVTGDFNFKSKVNGVENPSYVAVSNDGKYVYSVDEVKNGGISSFSLNQESGELTFLNHVSSGGASPCYVAVDDKNKYVFTSNYNSGNLSAIPLKADGSLGSDIQIIQHEGGSIDKGRQRGPHVHSTMLSPDNKYLLTPNLGNDKVFVYKIDLEKASQPLSPADPASISIKPGSGPRHLAFAQGSKYVYLITEMGGIIQAYDFKNGKLTEKQSITILSPEFKGRVGGADIHVSPDGKFLYGSNRGDANELVIYSINKNGTLTLVGSQSTLGKTPRNFVIDPTGNFLLAANMDSGEIIIFSRDKKTGLLTPTGKKIEVKDPVCLKFVNAAK